MYFPPREWLMAELVHDSVGLDLQAAEHLAVWAEAARTRSPVLFVGAGMSMNAVADESWKEREPYRLVPPRALSWKALAADLRARLTHIGEADEADALWIAELYEKAYGRDALLEAIERAVPDRLLKPSRIHSALFLVRWHSILTTNYDTLLQRASSRAQSLHECVRDVDLVTSNSGSGGNLELIHLHGRIDQRDSVVITLEDYRRYPVSRPGMLAKVRQLFLQHPILFVGVGATDPNFIQWSGWVADIVGRHRVPWLSLVPFEMPGAARRSYWAGALEFVHVKLDKMPKLFEVLAKFLNGIDSEDAVEHANQVLGAAESADKVVRELPGLLDAIGGGAPTERDYSQRRSVIRFALERIFVLKYGGDEGERKWALVRDIPRELEEPSATGVAPAKSRQIEMLCSALGDLWARFLVVHAKYVGVSLDVHGVVDFDLVDLLSTLPKESSEDIRSGLKLALLEDALERNPELSVENWLEGTKLSRSQFVELDDVLARRTFRMGTPILPLQSARSAAEHRRNGFLAALAGDAQVSSRHYFDAAQASRTESEPDWLEWLTVESAVRMRGLSRAMTSVSDDTSRPDATQEFRSLEERLRWLDQRIPRWLEVLDYERQVATDYVVDELVSKRSVFTRRVFGDRSERQRRALDRYESVWALPLQAGRAAELLGVTQWDAGERAEASRTLARYGSPVLSTLVSQSVRSEGRRGLEPGVIDVLLSDGRWVAEWSARAEALQHLVGELTRDETDRLKSWIARAIDRVVPYSRAKMLRGAKLYETVNAHGIFADTLINCWKLMEPTSVCAEWQEWSRMASGERDSFVRALAERMDMLPWSTWLKFENLSPQVADTILGAALEFIANRSLNPRARERLLGEILNLKDVPGGPLSAGERVRKAARAWIESSASQEPGLVALRTSWKIALSVSGEAAVAEQIDEIWAQFRRGKSIGSDLLYALARVSHGLDENQRQEIVARISDWLLPATDEYDDLFSSREQIIEAGARLASSLLLGGQDSLEEELLGALIKSISQVTVLKYATSVPIVKMRSHWDVVRKAVADALATDNATGASREYLTAIGSVRNFLEINAQDVSLPDEWFFELCRLAVNKESSVAFHALAVLGRVAGQGRLPNFPNVWRWWLRVMMVASDDPRASVSSAAAYALTIVPLEFAEDQVRALFEQARANVAADPRSQVRAMVRMADAERNHRKGKI